MILVMRGLTGNRIHLFMYSHNFAVNSNSLCFVSTTVIVLFYGTLDLNKLESSSLIGQLKLSVVKYFFIITSKLF